MGIKPLANGDIKALLVGVSQPHQGIIIWLVVWNHGILYDFPMIVGISSSQLTHIFQRGRYTTNQLIYIIIHHTLW